MYVEKYKICIIIKKNKKNIFKAVPKYKNNKKNYTCIATFARIIHSFS